MTAELFDIKKNKTFGTTEVRIGSDIPTLLSQMMYCVDVAGNVRSLFGEYQGVNIDSLKVILH